MSSSDAETAFSTASPEAPGLRARKRQERNNLILDCATELFQDQGYAETRMEEIAARADISAPTLYRYFPTKPALLIALLWKARQDRVAILEAFHNSAGSMAAVDAVTELLFINNRCGAPKKARRLWREMSAELLRSHDVAHDDFRMIKLEFERHIARLLENLHRNGSILRAAPLAAMTGVLYAIAAENFHRLIANEFKTAAEEKQALRDQISLALQGWLPKLP